MVGVRPARNEQLSCRTLAMNLVDDDALATTFLHNVVEETTTALEELPVNDRFRRQSAR